MCLIRPLVRGRDFVVVVVVVIVVADDDDGDCPEICFSENVGNAENICHQGG